MIRRSQGGLKAYAFSIAAVILASLFGYLVFRLYVADITAKLNDYGLLFIAMVAGVATFFSPCSFPLLPGYLSVYYSHYSGGRLVKGLIRALYYGAVAALGVVAFNVALGSAIGIAGEGFARSLALSAPNPSPLTRSLRIGLGAMLAFLGLAQLSDITFLAPLLEKLGAKRTPVALLTGGPSRALFLYGLGYNAAGMGCTGPILAGLMALALASGGLASALMAFLVYSAAMGVLMMTISALVGSSANALIDALRASAPTIKRLSGALLAFVGLLTIYATLDIQNFVKLLYP